MVFKVPRTVQRLLTNESIKSTVFPAKHLCIRSPLVFAMSAAVTTRATIASFGGRLLKLSHHATTTGCEMSFNLYLPPQAIVVDNAPQHKVPLLIYLSGLTCTADNCSEKGFFQHGASRKGIAVLYPDTSPR
jgi:S-formylglutathione hydrolase FrmB